MAMKMGTSIEEKKLNQSLSELISTIRRRFLHFDALASSDFRLFGLISAIVISSKSVDSSPESCVQSESISSSLPTTNESWKRKFQNEKLDILKKVTL